MTAGPRSTPNSQTSKFNGLDRIMSLRSDFERRSSLNFPCSPSLKSELFGTKGGAAMAYRAPPRLPPDQQGDHRHAEAKRADLASSEMDDGSSDLNDAQQWSEDSTRKPL